MTRAQAHHVRDLRHKIDLARGTFRLASDQAFAKEVGISPGRLSDYLSDRDGGPDHVSDKSLHAMAAFVAARLPGRLTTAQARLAWLADLQSFQRAIGPYPQNEFGDLVETTAVTLPLKIHIREGDFGLHEIDLNDLDPETQVLPAKSDFDLEVEADQGRSVIVLVECLKGWLLAVPRDPNQLFVGACGKIFVPPRGLQFSNEGGQHVFFAFAIDGLRPPRVIARAPRISPLSPDELNAFATDLRDTTTTRGFAMGRLSVFVRPA